MTREAYFENVLEYGNLYLDKVFNEFEDENIIFTCKDRNGNYFLTVCYEFRFKLEWILCSIDAYSLMKLISKKTDLHTIFKTSDKLINIISDSTGDHIIEVTYKDFNMSFLPTPGVYLKENFDLSYYFYNLYVKNIKPESLQSTRFINFELDIVSDEIRYSTAFNSHKIDYNITCTSCNNSNEYSRVNLVDAA